MQKHQKGAGRRRGVTIALVVGALFMGAGGAAFAAWILNSGTGYVTTASSVWTVSANAPTGGPLVAGGGQETMVVKITAAQVATLFSTVPTAAMTANGNGDVYNVLTSAFVASGTCQASLFTIGAVGPQSGTTGDGSLTGTNATAWTSTNNSANFGVGDYAFITFTVSLSASAPVTCQGLEPQITIVA